MYIFRIQSGVFLPASGCLSRSGSRGAGFLRPQHGPEAFVFPGAVHHHPQQALTVGAHVFLQRPGVVQHQLNAVQFRQQVVQRVQIVSVPVGETQRLFQLLVQLLLALPSGAIQTNLFIFLAHIT